MKRLLGLFHAGEQKNLYSTSGQTEFITNYFFKKSTNVVYVPVWAGEQKNLYSTSGQAEFITKYFF
jgi:hypothetical protein